MTILIKNILLLDGSDHPPITADVVIRNEKIVAIGSFPQYRADEVIDGLGGYLAPGFIDINTSSDLYLSIFSNPWQKEFLLQGVTTIIGGQNGISLAPILSRSFEIQKYFANIKKLNINWHNFNEFLTSLKRIKLGVNFGSFVGYATIKEGITNDDFRDLTQKEIEVGVYILEKAMKGGALGFSIDLTFPLTSLAPNKEIKSFLETVKKYNGVFSVKIRNGSDRSVYLKNEKDKFLDALNEIINLAKETSVKTQISNFTCLKGLEKEYLKALEIIEESAAVCDLYFDLHPFEQSIVPLFCFAPAWAQRGGFKQLRENLLNKEKADQIKKELPLIKGENIYIFDIPVHTHLIGKNLKDFSQERNLTIRDAIVELMMILNLRGTMIYKNLTNKNLVRALTSGRSIISSSASSFVEPHLKFKSDDDYPNAFSKYLQIVLKEKIMPIEVAVKKITSLPANRLGLKNRGMVKEGYFADLVIFREDGVVDTTIINGKIAVRGGKAELNTMGGEILVRKNV